MPSRLTEFPYGYYRLYGVAEPVAFKEEERTAINLQIDKNGLIYGKAPYLHQVVALKRTMDLLNWSGDTYAEILRVSAALHGQT